MTFPSASGSAVLRLLAGVARNIAAGARLALFLPVAPGNFRISPAQFAALFAANLVFALLGDMLRNGWAGSFNWEAVPLTLVQVPLVLLVCLIVATRLRRKELLLSLAVALISADPLFEFLGYLLSAEVLASWLSIRPNWNALLAYGFVFWSIAVSVRALLIMDGWRGRDSYVPMAWLVALVAIFIWAVPPVELWTAQDEDNPEVQASVLDEQLFHLQSELFDEALEQLEPQRSGTVDLYFLGAAPDASAPALARDVMNARQLFDTRFDTAGRSVVLANSQQMLSDVPLATLTQLREALAYFGEVMNREEDVLFLFIASQTDSEGQLMIDLPPLNLYQLTPAGLAGLLQTSGIKWKVIVISACHADAFAEPLRDANTLVIAAAGGKQCQTLRDEVRFNRQFFERALNSQISFAAAFEQTRAALGSKDNAPILHMGPAIEAKLHALEQRLAAKTKHPEK